LCIRAFVDASVASRAGFVASQGHRKKAKEWKQEHDEIAKLLVVHQMARDSSAMMKLLRKYN